MLRNLTGDFRDSPNGKIPAAIKEQNDEEAGGTEGIPKTV